MIRPPPNNKATTNLITKGEHMKYTVMIRYKDGHNSSWTVSDRDTAIFIFKTEVNRYSKQIRSAYMKGVRV